MDSHAWDARYDDTELVWSATPNQFVRSIAAALEPGRALDVAAGEGRNAIWLAEQGWQVDAADFSAVAVDRCVRLAAERGQSERVRAVVADATATDWDAAAYDLVLFSYLQLPRDDWAAALTRAVAATKPEGRIVVISHAAKNLTDGYGGPQDPSVLWDPADVVHSADGFAVTVERAELVERELQTDDGEQVAIDTVVIFRKH